MDASLPDPDDDAPAGKSDLGSCKFSVRRFRDRNEFEGTPHIHAAATFAEATNTLALSRFADLLADDATWTSDWGGTRHRGKRAILRVLGARFLGAARRREHYVSRVVVVPCGHAGVLTAVPELDTAALTTFDLDDDARITAVHVTSTFDRDCLRETTYCPPEA